MMQKLESRTAGPKLTKIVQVSGINAEPVVYGQGWKKSIVIDIRYQYFLLFVHRMHWSLYFFE